MKACYKFPFIKVLQVCGSEKETVVSHFGQMRHRCSCEVVERQIIRA
jgi:hypothetical protein